MLETLPKEIHVIATRIVNLWLIEEPHQLTLIDTGIKGGGPNAVLKQVAALGRKPADITRILITHADGDHTGGLAELVAATGARVFAREPDAEATRKGGLSRTFAGGALMRTMFKLFDVIAPLTPARVDEVLHDGDVLPVLGGLRAIATPGHTPGHTSFFFEGSRVLIAGDSMNATTGTLRWLQAPVHWDHAVGIESVKLQAALGARWVCCGHGKALVQPAFPFFADFAISPPAEPGGK